MKTAIVTGAGTGIGQSTTLALLNAGWQVVLAGRRESALQSTLTKAGDLSQHALAQPTDVANEESVEQLFGAAVAQFGRVDMVFNNAGMGTPSISLEEMTFDDWRQVMDVNINGMFLCARQAFRVMKDQSPQGGRIINNGSISAYSPRPGSAPYTTSKHAVLGLTKSAALDGRKYNIAVSQIDIGNAATDMTGRMTAGVPQADGRVLPEPRMDVNHVAQAICQMANLPLESNVQFMTIMATQMPFIGRG